MSQIPDFSKVSFAAPSKPVDPGDKRIWSTPEGIEVKSLYEPHDRDGAILDGDRRMVEVGPVAADRGDLVVHQPLQEVYHVRRLIDELYVQ